MDENNAWIPTLPELLRETNARLGWSQVHFAAALGKDQSEVSKILSGKTQRPQDYTLQQIVDVYNRAGLEVTIDQLIAARDAGRGRLANPWGFQPHWIRLLIRVMAEDQQFADWVYTRWSSDLEQIFALLRAREK